MRINKLWFLIALLTIFTFQIQAQVEQASAKKMKIYALRLRPNQDLRLELEKFTRENKISSGFIITAVGSLKETKIRLADKSDLTSFDGKFEIVSLVGTLAQDGVHLHISLSDGTGKTIGGHLTEGCKIYTTAEIVIGVTDEIVFTRETDSETTYKELKIRKKKKN
ncbi:MAG TPA: DNA-binding protein [Pyrinomonadaceae bacterium]|nr:DNA-binding protein [Pyrinomonadaceae bacterium]